MLIKASVFYIGKYFDVYFWYREYDQDTGVHTFIANCEKSLFGSKDITVTNELMQDFKAIVGLDPDMEFYNLLAFEYKNKI